MKRRSPLSWIAFSLCLLVLLIQAGQWIIESQIRKDWPSVREESVQRIYSTVQETFDSYQRGALQIARTVASLSPLIKEISARPKPDQRNLFNILQGTELEPETSVEVYDTSGILLAWWGRTAGLQLKQADVKQETSFVSIGAVYSYFTVVVPIRSSVGKEAFVVVHKLFDVNYPFSNRFISSAGFTQTFPRRLEYDVSYDFSHQLPRSNAEDVISIPLSGITGATIGYAYVDKPDLPALLENVRVIAQKIATLLLVLLSVLLSYVAGKSLHRSARLAVRLFAMTALLWSIRYVWLLMGFPSDFFTDGIFDPRYFASPFGFGIAKSLGELFLTSGVLCAGVSYVVYLLLPRFLTIDTQEKGVRSHRQLLGLLSVPILAFTVFLFHRGLTATVRSAVFDSTLQYSDPTAILPGFELAVALVSLLLIAVAFVGASVLVLAIMYNSTRSFFGSTSLNIFILFVILGAVGVLFGILHPNPLVGQFPRLAISSGLFLLCLYLVRVQTGTERFRVRSIALGVVVAAAILVYQLDGQVHQREGNKIELLGAELGKPVDAWLSFLVEQALREMSGEEAARTLMSDDVEELRRLAFTQWAKSILSREGYNCSVMFLDAEGHLVSTFRIGAQRLEPFSPSLQDLYLDSYARTPISVSEQAGAFGKRKIYSGSTIIADESELPVGSVAVIISAGEQTLFRGEATPILRRYGREETEQYLRTLTISEFTDGNLSYTTADEVPALDRLPQAVRTALERDGNAWVDEQLGPDTYETLYLRTQKAGQARMTLALSRKKVDWRWHIFDYLRPVLLYALAFSAVFIIFLVLLVLRGRRFIMSFRSKLLLAFFVVSLVPVVIIAYYNREITIERANQSIIDRLSAETSSLRTRLLRESGTLSSSEFARSLTDDWCESIATEVGTDFSVYLNGEEKASSKPELFETEILNRRLSGATFSHVVLEGRGFHTENQIIGDYAYLVGYRPLIASSGEVFGMLAVPILYKQLEIAEDLARRNALLFGAYALVVVFAAVVGAFFANQISYPVRQLIAATRRIAGGELDFQLAVKRTDEIGELHGAFNKMTSDLRQNREALIKAERALAWKEMAKQVAHEIKNPLTPMKLSIQHLRQAFHDNDKNFRELLEQVTKTIVGQIETLSRIASQFAHFGRMPERREERFDLREVLAESAKLFQEYKRVNIRMRLSPEPLVVHADREEMRRAFINVIRNAVQAMGERGTITMTSKSNQTEVQIEISDTGPGIPEEIRSRLFEPNFSTKSEGMGLGLPLVKKTIVDSHGTVEIRSEAGKGTTVTITLPVEHSIST